MKLSNSTIAVIRGKTSFAKILGEPVLNYSKDGKEWKMDLVLDPPVVKELKALGLSDRVKKKDDYLDGKSYITFKQRELRPDGTPNEPVRVVDINGQPWDHTKLLGNGTTVDVKFTVRDYGVGKKQGVYIRSVRVLDLVAYNKEEFAPISEDDEFYKAAKEMADANDAEVDKDFREKFLGETDDLDDEVAL